MQHKHTNLKHATRTPVILVFLLVLVSLAVIFNGIELLFSPQDPFQTFVTILTILLAGYTGMAIIRPVRAGWYAALLYWTIPTAIQIVLLLGQIGSGEVPFTVDGMFGIIITLAIVFFLFYAVYKEKDYFFQHKAFWNVSAVPIAPWVTRIFRYGTVHYALYLGKYVLIYGLALYLVISSSAVSFAEPGEVLMWALRMVIVLALTARLILFLYEMVQFFVKKDPGYSIFRPAIKLAMNIVAFIIALMIFVFIEQSLLPAGACLGLTCPITPELFR